VPKINLPTHLQKKIGGKKIQASSFISTNREGKKEWKEINTLPLNILLLHMVAKCKGV